MAEKYSKQLVKLLQAFNKSCSDIVKLTSSEDVCDKDIKYIQTITSNRVKELRKQVEQKHVEIDIILPSEEKDSLDAGKVATDQKNKPADAEKEVKKGVDSLDSSTSNNASASGFSHKNI